MPKNLNYFTKFDAEIKKDDSGREYVELKGSLMNFQANDNHWGITEIEKSNIMNTIAGCPVKIQHSDSDWEIVGTGIEGVAGNDFIGYISNITDTKAVDKFKTGTWNKDNMGISPQVVGEKITCSICNAEFDFGGYHEHFMGEIYNDKVCDYFISSTKLKEMSLTSNPAYKNTGSGNIMDINSFYASLNKEYNNINDKNKQIKADIMAEDALKKEIEAVRAEVEDAKKEVEEAKTGTEKVEKELEETKADLEEAKTGNEEAKKENEELKAEVGKIKGLYAEIQKGVREHELGEVIKNKEVIAEIIGKGLSDEDFKAEIKRYETIVAESKDVAGSAPVGNEPVSDEAKFKAEVDSLTKSLEMTAGIKKGE